MSTFSFKRKNTEVDEKFISYREVIEKLAAESGDSMRDVALFLKRGDVHKKNAIWLMGYERVPVADHGGQFLSLLLNETIEWNAVGPPLDNFGHEMASPDTSGWWRKELWSDLLFEFGIGEPASLTAADSEIEVTAVDNAGHQAAITALRRTEQDLAEAKSQVEALKIQLGDAQRSVEEMRRLLGDQSSIALHNTHLMRIALEVQRTYWNPPDRTKAKQEVIIAELMEKHGLLKPEAAAVERVACPINRRK